MIITKINPLKKNCSISNKIWHKKSTKTDIYVYETMRGSQVVLNNFWNQTTLPFISVFFSAQEQSSLLSHSSISPSSNYSELYKRWLIIFFKFIHFWYIYIYILEQLWGEKVVERRMTSHLVPISKTTFWNLFYL